MTLTRRGLFLTGAGMMLSRRNIAADLITLSPAPRDLEMPVEDFIDEINPGGTLLCAMPHDDSTGQARGLEAGDRRTG